MSDHYPIESKVPAKEPRTPIDLAKTRESIAKLKKIGDAFTIPVDDLRQPDGRYRTTTIGQRIHVLARHLGVKVSTEKRVEGLRVRRES